MPCQSQVSSRAVPVWAVIASGFLAALLALLLAIDALIEFVSVVGTRQEWPARVLIMQCSSFWASTTSTTVLWKRAARSYFLTC